ncbi:MAG: hypothetical protein SFU56_10120 [Capsulimonadales bacterium]|nr:hypothetical protein [Capsulimonadales bacterium]
MNEKTKTILIAVVTVLAVAAAGYFGWNSLKDNSQPTVSPTYAKLSPEERERIRREGLAIRAGKRPSSAPSGTPAP